MARTWLDAELGRIFDNGTEKEILGGLNFVNFTITRDDANNRYDIALTAVPDFAVNETFSLRGILSPAQITANQNNYNPAGLADTTIVRVSSNANNLFIGGIAGGAKGRVLIWENVGTFSLDFDHENTSSTDVNRILGVTGAAGRHSMQAGEGAVMYWDNAAAAGVGRWQIIGTRTDVLGRFTVSASGTGNFDNLARSSGTYVRMSPTGSAVQNLTGMDASVDRGLACISNVGTQLLAIKHDVTSTAGLRFLTPDGRDYPLHPGMSVWCVYDLTAARWRVLGPNGEPSQGAVLTGAAGTPGQTIVITEGAIRYLRSNLANNFTLDIDNTSARDDETITIVRCEPSPTANTFTIRDHSNNTIGTLTASAREAVTFKKAAGGNFASPVYTRL